MAISGQRLKRTSFQSALTVALALLLALAASGLNVRGVRAANQVVTNANNSGAGSLRQAIIDVGAGEQITFSAFFNTPRTITLTIAANEMVINKSVTITGPGSSNLTINGASTGRILNIQGNANVVSISGMTLTNGSGVLGGAILNASQLTLDDLIVTENQSTTTGGGIANAAGTLAISNSTISNNTAATGSGGVGSLGNLTITNSTISGNTATAGGSGGIGVIASTATITNSIISGNTATAGGNGGIGGLSAMTITGSTISGNTATTGNGGGITNAGALTITSSTISGNTATAGNGGGINQSGGTLTIKSSTISGNSATDATNGNGGGINTSNSGTIGTPAVIANTTIAGNSARLGGGVALSSGFLVTSVLAVLNSTVAGNTVPVAGNGGGFRLTEGTSANTSLGLGNTILANTNGNIAKDAGSAVSSSSGGSIASDAAGLDAGNLNSTDPLLDPAGLQNNGGPTQTITLQATSPALGYGVALVCSNVRVGSVDQRGLTRPQGTGCDSGATESRSTAIVADDVTAAQGGTMTLSATLSDTSSGSPVALSGKTVVFKLNGTQVCDNGPTYLTACPTTDSSGVAKLTGVAVPGSIGDYPDAIEALFLGATDYLPSSDKSKLTVLAAQFIHFANPGTITYGDTPTITATSKTQASASAPPTGLLVTFTSQTPLVCTVGSSSLSSGESSAQLTAVGVGTCTIEATQAGDSTYAPATPVQQSFTVNKKSLTVTAANGTRPFGSSTVPCVVSFDGFVFSDTQQSTITGSAGCTTNATTSSPPGPGYQIIPNAGTLTATNYTFGPFVNGTLTIENTQTTLSQVALTGTYGSTSGTLTATLRRTVDNAPLANMTVQFTINGVAACGVSGKPTCPKTNAQGVATLGGQTVPLRNAGTHNDYVIVASFAGDTYYYASTGQGRLVINRAVITVKPKDQQIKVKAPNPTTCELQLSAGSQFLNGDTWSAVNLTNLRCQYSRIYPAGTTNEKPGATYRITALGASSTNYELRYEPGLLTAIP